MSESQYETIQLRYQIESGSENHQDDKTVRQTDSQTGTHKQTVRQTQILIQPDRVFLMGYSHYRLPQQNQVVG